VNSEWAIGNSEARKKYEVRGTKDEDGRKKEKGE
jgi:hypothetical protein